ncbi:MAG: Spy/CpxP family protein refolding chaperone [Gammaproteobacteria bacterium]|nr:Spy/CpxP family protein refolding chaperone [Gammaproteobacteria bacterium]
MKKRNLILATLLAGSLGVASVGVTHACDGPGGNSRGDQKSDYRGGGMKKMMKKLDLTKEQRQTIRNIKSESRDQMQAKREQMGDIRNALREQGRAKTLDVNKVRELADAKSKIMADMTVQRITTMHKVRKELTPEQLVKFDAMKEKRSKRGGS